ncbi:MAG TPA: ChbG/HpnK family deacetylase, partial [Candidatus Binataceae bacterium]|nr:ChbG/HpnK family deacetylase [Candidatus Binataceae bacterium]
MKQLVVNADDLGMTRGVNRGIIEAHRSGLVTSTSLIANGAAFEDAVARIRPCPDLSVGLHVNLTAGK